MTVETLLHVLPEVDNFEIGSKIRIVDIFTQAHFTLDEKGDVLLGGDFYGGINSLETRKVENVQWQENGGLEIWVS